MLAQTRVDIHDNGIHPFPEQIRCGMTMGHSMVTLKALTPFVGTVGAIC